MDQTGPFLDAYDDDDDDDTLTLILLHFYNVTYLYDSYECHNTQR